MDALSRFNLLGKKEREAVKLLNDHMALVVAATSALGGLLKQAVDGDWEALEETVALISRYETEADFVHREAVKRISKGAFFAGMREDFLNLMEGMDDIADAAQNAARILSQDRIRPEVLKALGQGEGTIEGLLNKVTEAVRAAASCIDALQSGAEKAVDAALGVELLEEEADNIKVRLLRRLYSLKHELEALTLLQLKDFILKLDEIADAAEDCSDQIVMIVAKGYG